MTSQLDQLTLAVLGISAVLLGLVELALGLVRRLLPWQRSLVLSGFLSLLGSVAFATGQPVYLWQPALALAVAELLLALVCSPLLSLVARTIRPAVQSATLVVLGAALVGWQVYQLEQGLESNLMATDRELAQLADPIDTNGPPALVVNTDTGRAIPLYNALPDLTTISADTESRHLQDLKLHLKTIQVGPADMKYNCHGWVFASGRYWLRGIHVADILADNGYRAVERPAPGDVAVFRNGEGAVIHSGLVRASGDGPILIESKWGRMGRYIHTADDHAYRGQSLTYYRTSRTSHVLGGSEYPKPASQIAAH
jgi:hypothetical protein